MGIQSTRCVTREEAELMYVRNYMDKNRLHILQEAKALTDEQLEDQLESTFDNYMITENA